MLAVPEVEWDVLYRMSAPEMVATLLDLAQRVNLRALRKSPRGPKKPPPKRDGNSKQGMSPRPNYLWLDMANVASP
jgi:hypothetical protein